MKALTGSQRKHLRELAHHLAPVIYVGKHGLTPALIQSVEQALSTQELIKIKFVDKKDEKRTISDAIERETGGALVGLIGNIATLYREHRDESKRRIQI